jgi:Effector Associated Constant Component 1
MENDSYEFTVQADNRAAAGSGAMALADVLREADGVLEVDRSKADDHAMDLGAIVEVVASSGAALAIARGLATWLRARRGVTVSIRKKGPSRSLLKATVAGLDPEAAVRIVEALQDS